MARRFQFSLRVLLGVVVFASLVLGGWRLFGHYGTYVDAENVRIGAPIRIKASYFCAVGPYDCGLVVGYARADEAGSVSKYLRAKRSWLCFYSVEYELDPLDRPGDILVFLQRYEGSHSWTLKEKIVEVN